MTYELCSRKYNWSSNKPGRKSYVEEENSSRDIWVGIVKGKEQWQWFERKKSRIELSHNVLLLGGSIQVWETSVSFSICSQNYSDILLGIKLNLRCSLMAETALFSHASLKTIATLFAGSMSWEKDVCGLVRELIKYRDIYIGNHTGSGSTWN